MGKNICGHVLVCYTFLSFCRMINVAHGKGQGNLHLLLHNEVAKQKLGNGAYLADGGKS